MTLYAYYIHWNANTRMFTLREAPMLIKLWRDAEGDQAGVSSGVSERQIKDSKICLPNRNCGSDAQSVAQWSR